MKSKEEMMARYRDVKPVTGYTRANGPVAASDGSGKYALIWPFDPDRNVTGFEYDEFIFLEDIFVFLCRKGASYQLIGYDDQRIFSADLEACHPVCKGFYVVEADGKYGILTGSDMDSNFDPVLDDIAEKEGNVQVCLNGEWGYVDEGGDFISEADYDEDFDDVLRFGADVLDWSWKKVQTGQVSEKNSDSGICVAESVEESRRKTISAFVEENYRKEIDWSAFKVERRYTVLLAGLEQLWGNPEYKEDIKECLHDQPEDLIAVLLK